MQRFPPPPAPNIVLILIDTLRADHLGAYGYPRPTSPIIDGLADRGVVFTNATSNSSLTRPSVASIFTSRLPSEHGAYSFRRSIAPGLPTLAECLHNAGYKTFGVSGNFVHINEPFGFGRGFDRWREVSIELADGDDDEMWPNTGPKGGQLSDPPATLVNKVALGFLSPSDVTPFFLYLHYMEPHSPYDAPEPIRSSFVSDPAMHAGRPEASSRYLIDLARTRPAVDPAERQRLIDLYDAEIATVDRAIGGLLDALKQRGLDKNTVVAVVSDHGEEFGEHGGWVHGGTLHRESVWVPFIVHDARRPTRGILRDEPVDLLDVATTLLSLAGVDACEGMRGRPLLSPDGSAEREIIAELHLEDRPEDATIPRLHRLALMSWPWRVILGQDETRSFFRVDRDPGESDPLPPATSELEDLGASAERARKRLDTMASRSRAGSIDARTQEGLRTLGYTD
ncbi:MAG: hypothetical protein E4H03_00395 [Myxococcales bacterium]|nr:MAG: hypothetical protein E4H03_00395 [Myxococcales bacterium]